MSDELMTVIGLTLFLAAMVRFVAYLLEEK
jgi:hypothetical protein